MTSRRTNVFNLKALASTASRPVVESNHSSQNLQDGNGDNQHANRTDPLLGQPSQTPHTRLQREEWRPKFLAAWANALLLLVEAAIIAVLFAVWAISKNKNGAFEIHQALLSVLLGTGVSRYYSLLWTSFPAFLVTLYTFGWSALVSASAELQPYIELSTGGPARITVMLDYCAIPLWKVAFVAFRNTHYHISTGYILQILLTAAAAPFAAHLLVQRSAYATVTAHVDVVSNFQEFSQYIDIGTNLQPFIDIATSIQTYNTTPPLWMTDTMAFEQFKYNNSNGNLSVPVRAYFANLQCNIIPDGAYTFTQNSVQISLKGNDRGCPVDQSFRINQNVSVHTLAWFQSCTNDGTSRIGIFAADQDRSDTSKLNNLRIVSCAPTYWSINGTLNLAYGVDGMPSYSSFDHGQNQSVQLSPGIRFPLEQNIMYYSQQSTTTAIDANTVGFAVYSTAQVEGGDESPNVQALSDSIQRIYGTIFAATMTNLALKPSGTPRSTPASFTTSTSKLFVVNWVVWLEVGIFFAVLLCHIWLFWYSRTHHTMLDEEVYGLLGKAKLLLGSNLFGVVEDFNQKHEGVGKMRKYMKDYYPMGRERCRWDEESRTVLVEGFEE